MELFRDMQRAGARPNEFTLTTVPCANLVELEQGRRIHMFMKKECRDERQTACRSH